MKYALGFGSRRTSRCLWRLCSVNIWQGSCNRWRQTQRVSIKFLAYDKECSLLTNSESEWESNGLLYLKHLSIEIHNRGFFFRQYRTSHWSIPPKIIPSIVVKIILGVFCVFLQRKFDFWVLVLFKCVRVVNSSLFPYELALGGRERTQRA